VIATGGQQVFEWREEHDVDRYRATEEAKIDRRKGEQVK
jgi:hypothetical protein